MVLLQKLPPTLTTFGNLSDYLLKKILSGGSRVAFFVTDFYLENSVKSMERDRRAATGSLRVKVVRRDQAVPKQFSRFLRNSENKLELLDFLLNDFSSFSSTIGFSSCKIITVDSDVAFLCLYFQCQLDINIYLQMGTGTKEKTFEVFSSDLSDDVLKALPSIHALSGCDSTSALVGVGKVKLYNTVCKRVFGSSQYTREPLHAQ